MPEKYYSLSYDCTFKFLFGYKANIKFTESFIEALLDLEEGALRSKIKILNSLKLNKEHIMDKSYEVDILVEMPDGNIINLEVYRGFNEAHKIKSLVYLAHMLGNHLKVGEKYTSINKYQQFNLVKYSEGKLRSYIEYRISDTDLQEEYLPDIFKINIIRVDKARDSIYNINDRLRKWLMFINADSLKEATKIVKEDKIMEAALRRLLKFFDKSDNYEVYDKEAYQRAVEAENLRIGENKGKKEKANEMAMSMLKDNVDDIKIIKYTGLTKAQLNELKKTV